MTNKGLREYRHLPSSKSIRDIGYIDRVPYFYYLLETLFSYLMQIYQLSYINNFTL